jgi:regulatory protein
MDNGEQGENSNSRKDNLVVLSVTKRGAGIGQVKVALSNGSFFLLLEEIQQKTGILPGDECSLEDIEELVTASDRKKAEKKALSLLSYTPHSREGLKLKLMKRGFPEESIEYSLLRMEELGYLDDLKFAEEWLRSRLKRHPEGKWALLAGLKKRGVSRTTAEAALATHISDEMESEAAARALSKMMGGRPLTRIQAAAKLASKGFSNRVINRALTDFPYQAR